MNINNQRIPVVDFCNDIKSNEVRINRNYQRSDKVWPPAAKSFLIETILLDYPIPKLLLSQHTNLRTRRSHKEIVDGQQRSRAILSYFDGEFRISRHSEEDRFAGRSLEELEEDDRKRFLDYGLAVDLMVGATPDQIRETFRRINSYTVPLNPEEHRHAVFQGDFKWFMHDLTKRFDEGFIRIDRPRCGLRRRRRRCRCRFGRAHPRGRANRTDRPPGSLPGAPAPASRAPRATGRPARVPCPHHAVSLRSEQGRIRRDLGTLTRSARCITLVQMERIGIRDLHMKTGEWVRRSARGEGVVVTERGRPVASLVPFREGDAGRSFRDRILLPEFEALPAVPGDSTADVSDDRDRG